MKKTKSEKNIKTKEKFEEAPEGGNKIKQEKSIEREQENTEVYGLGCPRG
jgi:hypothetical protein